MGQMSTIIQQGQQAAEQAPTDWNDPRVNAVITQTNRSTEMADTVKQLAEKEFIPAEFGKNPLPSWTDDRDLSSIKALYDANLQKSGIDTTKLPGQLSDNIAFIAHEHALDISQREVAASETKLSAVDVNKTASDAVKSPDNNPFVIDWEKVKAHAASQSTPEQAKADAAQIKTDETNIRNNIATSMQKDGILTADPAAQSKLNKVMDQARTLMSDEMKTQVSHDASAKDVQSQSVPVAPGGVSQNQR